MIEQSCKNKCISCNKNYASSNSLWNHNKKFHNNNKTKDVTIINQNIEKINNSLNCKYCKKKFNYRSNRWYHEKTCKVKILEISKLEKLEKFEKLEKYEKLEKKIQELEKKIENTNNSKKINNEKDTLLKQKLLDEFSYLFTGTNYQLLFRCLNF